MWVKFLHGCTRMLTCDLFAVANLLVLHRDHRRSAMDSPFSLCLSAYNRVYTIVIVRRYASARSLLSPGVRLSRWSIVSTRLKKSSNFFLHPVAPSLQYFLPPSPVTDSKRTPSGGAQKYTTVGKICDFRPKSPFILEIVRDRPMVVTARNVNRKS